jgi:hypothetical protein
MSYVRSSSVIWPPHCGVVPFGPGLLVICWMSLSPAWTGRMAAHRSPFHSFLVTVIGTLTILGAGLLLGLLSNRSARC